MLSDFKDRIDFDGDVARQRAGADGRTRMLAGIAEHLDHKVRSAVDDFRMVGEAWNRIDESRQLYAALDAIEVTATGLAQLCDEVERA